MNYYELLPISKPYMLSRDETHVRAILKASYHQGKKVGRWNFFSRNGAWIETTNFS